MIQNKRHKHADLIHAWAEGAEIQYYDNISKQWIETVDNNPSWRNSVNYRIKPKIKTIRFRNYLHSIGIIMATDCDISDRDYFKKWLGDWQSVEIDENE